METNIPVRIHEDRVEIEFSNHKYIAFERNDESYLALFGSKVLSVEEIDEPGYCETTVTFVNYQNLRTTVRFYGYNVEDLVREIQQAHRAG